MTTSIFTQKVVWIQIFEIVHNQLPIQRKEDARTLEPLTDLSVKNVF